MAYSRIKVWIAAEILTASDLNAEHNGHITNENDLDTRLITEVAARTTLEGEHDTLQTNLWDGSSNQVADNRVGKTSMKNEAIGTLELEDLAVTEVKCAAAIKDPAADIVGLRTLGTGALQALPGDTALTEDGSVTIAKLADTIAGAYTVITAQAAEYCHNGTSYTKITEIRIAIAGAIRTKFHLRRYDTTGVAYGQLYKNGAAVGTERSNTSSTGVWYEEDLSGFETGDLLQLYTKQSNSSGQVCAKQLSLSITAPLKNLATLES